MPMRHDPLPIPLAALVVLIVAARHDVRCQHRSGPREGPPQGASPGAAWRVFDPDWPTLSPGLRNSVAPVPRPARGPQGRQDPWGAEDYHQEGFAHRIPEPMVFDLVRPLGARAGEFEANVLGIVPLRSTKKRNGDPGDPLGTVPDSKDKAEIEWAAEVEYAPWDGFALEFEVPFEGGRLEAWKFAAQWTLGEDRSGTFIHGLQGILQYNDEPGSWTPTLVYIAGKRFATSWSALGMVGARGEFGGTGSDLRREFLCNLNVFFDVSHSLTLGLETNTALAGNGRYNVLLMPQAHWEVSDRCMLQFGIGARVDEQDYLPELGFRFVVTF